VVASDKLFYWLFQHQPDRILPLLPDLPADARGYRFSAPVLKEREYRLDGLFLPPPERPELPALILEAQMAADGGFLRRLYAETARLLQQEPGIERWRVVVLCPSRQLHFGDPAPVAEFVEQRVQWIELLSAAANPTAPALVQALALLLQSEQELPATTSALRARVAGSSQAAEIDRRYPAPMADQSRSSAPWAASPSTTSPRAWPTARSLGGERPQGKPLVRPEASPWVKSKEKPR
jgi:hypothetical protein